MGSPQPEPKRQVPEFRFSPNPKTAHLIDWSHWSTEAFERAKAERKPLLLSISAVWCHWCHVMDETSYSDEQVISLINERYVPVRVDADKRPDIQERYLMGGWPTTALLTTNGEVMSGGTYIPPQEFKSLLEQVSDYYTEHRDRLEEVAEQQRRNALQAASAQVSAPYKLERELVSEVLDILQRSFDARHGGFAAQPKFPNSPAIELLLRRAYLEDNTDLLEMVIRTLNGMAGGGLMDKEWGGFFRYATESDWSVPHYEKMLGDNAALIVNYLHGYQVSGQIRYREIAEKTLGFVHTFLADLENGGFYGSQDADEEFYLLSTEERPKRTMPYIDPVIYTDVNAAMVTAYLEAYKVLGRREYRDFALRTLDLLLDACFSSDAGMAHYFDGEAKLYGRISDQAYTIGALIDAYGITGERPYIDAAVSLADMCERALLADDGTFFDVSELSGEPVLGALAVKSKPIFENALLARQLHRLAYLTDEIRFEEVAEKALVNLELGTTAAVPALALYGLAVDEFLTQPAILTIVTTGDEPGAKELVREAFRVYLPGKELKMLDPIGNYAAVKSAGYPAERHPAVYPCIGRMCLPAIDTPHELLTLIEELPGRPK